MEIDLQVRGVALGNTSSITVEVQPGRVGLKQPTYQLNMTAAHITGVHGGYPAATQNLALAFFLSRANLTGAPMRPLVTEREHFRPLLQALPQNPRAPQKIEVNTGFNAMNDVDFWRDGTKALVGFGMSGLSASASSVLAGVFRESGVQYAGTENGMLQQAAAPNVSKRCGGWTHTSPDVDHCWGATDDEVAGNLRLYAAAVVHPMRAAGFTKLTANILGAKVLYGIYMDLNPGPGRHAVHAVPRLACGVCEGAQSTTDSTHLGR